VELSGRTVILVDDGLATGATMRAAVAALREHDPAGVVVAVPVAPEETCRELERLADELICLSSPEPFLAIGVWYERFEQVSDDEVRELVSASPAAK
jgi:predicted phosphoribosyltransferase